MLTIDAHKRSSQMLIGVLLCGLPILGFAKEPRRAVTPAEDAMVVETAQNPNQQPIGAPQVLEIPPIQDTGSLPTNPSPPEVSSPVNEHALGAAESNDREAQAEASMSEANARRTYFGVLYATAEEGPVGVKVLDVIPGSPAARAGFEGVNTPPSQPNDLLKLGLMALMMSPVGPFAVPLVIAHDMYRASQSPGDLIVAIGEHQVRDAVEFSQEMHRYRPGDTVTFSILRKGKSLQVPVQLEEEPS